METAKEQRLGGIYMLMRNAIAPDDVAFVARCLVELFSMLAEDRARKCPDEDLHGFLGPNKQRAREIGQALHEMGINRRGFLEDMVPGRSLIPEDNILLVLQQLAMLMPGSDALSLTMAWAGIGTIVP